MAQSEWTPIADVEWEDGKTYWVRWPWGKREAVYCSVLGWSVMLFQPASCSGISTKGSVLFGAEVHGPINPPAWVEADTPDDEPRCGHPEQVPAAPVDD